MNTVQAWLHAATKQLHDTGIDTARLDAELILGHTMGRNRTWLAAHSDETLSSDIDRTAQSLVDRRGNREPLAYLTGTKEFYGRNFVVSPAVLIPRPETEDLIDLIKTCRDIHTAIDIGCGSGCIGITAALELPGLNVTLADISEEALAIAKTNGDSLGADVAISQSDLLNSSALQGISYDIIIANLPYVDRAWQRSPETDHEPSLALFAEDGGLKLIKKLITQAPDHLRPSGYVLLEADPEQHDDIVLFAQKHGLRKIEDRGYALLLQRD